MALEPFGVLSVGSGRGSTRGWEFTAIALRQHRSKPSAFCPYLEPLLHEHVLCLARGHLRIGDRRLIVLAAEELRIGRVSA